MAETHKETTLVQGRRQQIESESEKESCLSRSHCQEKEELSVPEGFPAKSFLGGDNVPRAVTQPAGSILRCVRLIPRPPPRRRRELSFC